MKYHKLIITSFICILCFAITILIWNIKKTPDSVEVLKDNLGENEIIDFEKFENESLKIATLYKDLYIKSEKNESDYIQYDFILNQDDIDNIENFLISKEYPVINSDEKYPEYLENANIFYNFWNKVSIGENADQNVIFIHPNGSMLYMILKQYDNIKYRIGITVEWDDKNEPYVYDTEYCEITEWDLVDNTNFYYMTHRVGPMYDDYILIRLKEVDKKLYDLNAKYILPIGYVYNNMFICDWSYKDYGMLCFNDLLEGLYMVRNNKYFNIEEYPKVTEPYTYSYIPSSLFESTIMPYFDISLQEFRKKCLYDKELDIYPWQEICNVNFASYPSVEPEVISYKENEDGTIILTVNARCNDFKTTCLFSHEVTIRQFEDGTYHYLGNKVIYKSEYELPTSEPRLPMQRTKL